MTKPVSYHTHLIRHEGDGSIISILKQKGWATSLSAGVMDIPGFLLFQVTVDLSKEGLENYKSIITIIFQYIQMLQQQEWEIY